MPADGGSCCFGYVQTYDTKPKRRLFDVLAAQGMQPNQQVTFLTDGAEDIRELPRYLNPQAEHVLDWFHLTMRITVLTQLAKGPRCPPQTAPDVAAQAATGEVVPLARQRLGHPELRGALPRRRDHLHLVRGIRGQPGDQQAHGQKAADALDPRGAHLLLQIRTRVLNDQLADDFHRRHPGFTHRSPNVQEPAAAA